MSKLDAFEEFVLRAKMPALALSHSAGNEGETSPSAAPSQQQKLQRQQGRASAAAPSQITQQAQQRPKMVIVDDLPLALGPVQGERLASALRDLARTARFPLVVCATETSGKAQQEKGLAGGAGSFMGLPKVKGGG